MVKLQRQLFKLSTASKSWPLIADPFYKDAKSMSMSQSLEDPIALQRIEDKLQQIEDGHKQLVEVVVEGQKQLVEGQKQLKNEIRSLHQQLRD
jgi:hypothetical protein